MILVKNKYYIIDHKEKLPVGHDEMKQRPQFFETILEGSTSYEQSMICMEIHQSFVQ